MSGLKRKAQHEQQPEKKGGMVRGPGTGTSDSIRARVPDGSFIMPADSTAQIGENALNQMGAPRLGLPWKRQQDVPVNLSNGEFNLPPEQVHAVGAEALRQMKDATHAPVAAAQNGGPRLGLPGYVAPEEKPTGGGFGLNLERLRRHAEEMKNGGPRLGLPGYVAPEEKPTGGGFGLNLERLRRHAEEMKNGGPRLGWPGYVPSSSPEPSGKGFGFKRREGDQGEPGPFFADGGEVGKERGFGWRGYADGGLVEDDTKTPKLSPMGISYNDVRSSAPARQPSGPIGSNVSSTGPTTRPIVKPQAQQPATTESPSGFTPVQYGKIDQSLLPRNSPQMPGNMSTGNNQAAMRPVAGAPDVARYDSTDPNQSPTYSNVIGDQARGGSVSSVGPGPGPDGVASMQRAAAMNAENNSIRQNRMDGRPDGWSRETVSSDKQHLTYQRNKAMEDADRARFFGPTLVDQRNAEQGGGRRRGGQSASEAQGEKAAAYDTRAQGYQRALTALGDNESAMQQTQMREQGDTQRAQTREQGADRRTLIEQSAQEPMRQAQARGQELENSRYAQQNSLIDSLLNETDPGQRNELAQQLRLAMGQAEPKRDPFQIAVAEDLIDQSRPFLGTVKTPYVIDPVTGQGRSVVQPSGSAGGRVAAPTFEQYATQIRARNPGVPLSDADIQEKYRETFS